MAKYYILILFVVSALVACKTGSVKNSLPVNETTEAIIEKEISIDSINGAYLLLDKTRHDFGKIKRKNTPHIAIDFFLENIGKDPLIIIKADVSCGCISGDYPRKPILQGEKIVITVNIDTKNQKGEFNKTVFIKSNAENDVVLIRIVGKIK